MRAIAIATVLMMVSLLTTAPGIVADSSLVDDPGVSTTQGNDETCIDEDYEPLICGMVLEQGCDAGVYHDILGSNKTYCVDQ